MRKIYRALAWAIAGSVVVQAAAIAFAFGGLLNRVSNGDVVDKALLESRTSGGVGEAGFFIHAIVGAGLLPLLAIALVVVSFFVRAKGARLWAAIVLALVVAQISMGFLIVGSPYLGLVHGANAFAVLATAVIAALRVGRMPRTAAGSNRPGNHEGASSDAVTA